jgi:hypothetical protein
LGEPGTPLAIALQVPEWYEGERDTSVAPGWNMLKLPWEEYQVKYATMLDGLIRKEGGLENLYRRLNRFPDTILLCWETKRTKCHRGLLAEEFETGLRIIVPELLVDIGSLWDL